MEESKILGFTDLIVRIVSELCVYLVPINFIKTNMLLTSTGTTEESKTPDTLDYTFVPQDVDKDFIDTVRPFFNKAHEIYTLWQLALTAHQESALTTPIQDFHRLFQKTRTDQENIQRLFLCRIEGSLQCAF